MRGADGRGACACAANERVTPTTRGDNCRARRNTDRERARGESKVQVKQVRLCARVCVVFHSLKSTLTLFFDRHLTFSFFFPKKSQSPFHYRRMLPLLLLLFVVVCDSAEVRLKISGFQRTKGKKKKKE
jgi:hypothetical protein